MGRGLLFAALTLGLASALASAAPPAAEARRQLQEGGAPGTCIEIHTISGDSFEDGQDKSSLQVGSSWPDLWVAVGGERAGKYFWRSRVLVYLGKSTLRTVRTLLHSNTHTL